MTPTATVPFDADTLSKTNTSNPDYGVGSWNVYRQVWPQAEESPNVCAAILSAVPETGCRRYRYLTPDFRLTTRDDATYSGDTPKRGYYRMNIHTVSGLATWVSIARGNGYGCDHIATVDHPNPETAVNLALGKLRA